MEPGEKKLCMYSTSISTVHVTNQSLRSKPQPTKSKEKERKRTKKKKKRYMNSGKLFLERLHKSYDQAKKMCF